jgi:hypothetical protein
LGCLAEQLLRCCLAQLSRGGCQLLLAGGHDCYTADLLIICGSGYVVGRQLNPCYGYIVHWFHSLAHWCAIARIDLLQASGAVANVHAGSAQRHARSTLATCWYYL